MSRLVYIGIFLKKENYLLTLKYDLLGLRQKKNNKKKKEKRKYDLLCIFLEFLGNIMFSLQNL